MKRDDKGRFIKTPEPHATTNQQTDTINSLIEKNHDLSRELAQTDTRLYHLEQYVNDLKKTGLVCWYSFWIVITNAFFLNAWPYIASGGRWNLIGFFDAVVWSYKQPEYLNFTDRLPLVLSNEAGLLLAGLMTILLAALNLGWHKLITNNEE